MRPAPFALLVSSIVCACSSPSGPSLRPNVRTVIEFPAVSTDCLARSLCPQYVAPEIVDVAREGQTVAVLYSWVTILDAALDVTSISNGVVVSRDGGETWTSVPLNIRGVGGTDPSLNAGAHGIALRDGEIYVTYPYYPESGVLAALDRQQVFALRETNNRLGEINYPWLLDAPTSLHPGVFGFDYWGPSPVYASRAAEIDIRNGTITGEHEQTLTYPPEQTPCASAPWRWAPDAGGTVHLFGICHRPDGLVCEGHATMLDGWVPFWACVPQSTWPVPAGIGESTVVVGTRQSSVLFREMRDGAPFTRAARIASGGGVAVDVGPGQPLLTLADDAWVLTRPGATPPMHRRWGDLVALVRDLPEMRTEVTLYRAAGTGFAATSLPTRPCADGADCGYRVITNTTLGGGFVGSVLVWALPMGSDDYLLFYVLDQRPDMQHVRNAIYVSREHLDRGAGAASAIERSCALAQTCVGPVDVAACARRWMTVEYSDAERVAFEAATTCDAVLRADPSLRAGEQCGADEERCDGDLAIGCQAGFLSRVIDCHHAGMVCDVSSGIAQCVPPASCPAGTCDAIGRAYRCDSRGNLDCGGAGLSCFVSSTGPTCGDDGEHCAGMPAGSYVCDGDVSSRCDASGRAEAFADCARIGLACDPSSSLCAGDGACEDATYFAQCSGSHLRYCLFGTLRDVDCGALAATCTNDGVARCVPTMARPDASVWMPDAGPPACGTATLSGPSLPEMDQPNYPTPSGGTIADGRYVLTSFEVWSAAVQPYTHRETLIVHGGTFERIEEHGALGVSSSTGTITTSGSDITLTSECPAPMPLMQRYIATGSSLVLLQDSFIRTYVRM